MSVSSKVYVAVVDDDESVCRALGRLLRASGYCPITYSSGEAFLSDLTRPKFGCLILDIQFPGISGIELKERLNAAGSEIPVIYITGSDDSTVRQKALEAGCVGYFRKQVAGFGSDENGSRSNCKEVSSLRLRSLIARLCGNPDPKYNRQAEPYWVTLLE